MQKIFAVNEKNFSPLDEALTAACEGLIYISETDSPVAPFLGEKVDEVSAEVVRRHAGAESSSPVEELDLAAFFGKLTREREWYTNADRVRAKKFLELQELLEENLVNAKVFRFGRIRVDIFAVGIGPDHRIMGIKTYAVET